MTEHYYGGGNGIKRLSRAEIRKMKENMQKTPLVQEKANKYHRLEEEKAEKLLTTIVNEEEEKISKKSIDEEEKTTKKLGLIDRIKKYLFG